MRKARLTRVYSILFLMLAIGSACGAAQFQFLLRGVNGVEHRQNEWIKKRAIVIFFKTIDCPLSNGYVPVVGCAINYLTADK